MDYFPKNVKFLRLQKAMSQAEMAAIVVISQAAWSEYELGTSRPRLTEFKKITDYFCISASELLELDLEKLNLNEIIELRKMLKKLNPKLKLSLNPNDGNNKEDRAAKAAKTKAIERLGKLEKELKELRSKIGG